MNEMENKRYFKDFEDSEAGPGLGRGPSPRPRNRANPFKTCHILDILNICSPRRVQPSRGGRLKIKADWPEAGWTGRGLRTRNN